MRISDEIDALEVMGISSMTFLCATRLLAAWLVLPFMYLAGIGAGFFASYLAVVQQIGEVSSGGYFLIFWMFQNPPDLLYSVIKAMTMATVIVLVGCYYGYNASGGPVGVGTATAKSMVLNIVLVHLIGMLGTQFFWGANPAPPSEDERGDEQHRDDEFKWHTGKQRPTGARTAVEFVDVHKSFGPQPDPARPQHGDPRGQDLDDPRPVGDREVRLHQAHGRPAVPRRR
jgi:hypothetical protein